MIFPNTYEPQVRTEYLIVEYAEQVGMAVIEDSWWYTHGGVSDTLEDAEGVMESLRKLYEPHGRTFGIIERTFSETLMPPRIAKT